MAEGKAGEIKWTARVIHAGENIGETETHISSLNTRINPVRCGPKDSEDEEQEGCTIATKLAVISER